VITHTGQVFYTAAAHKHDRVFLQVMTHARDISRYLDAVCKAHTSDFTKSRVRLLRRYRVNARANAAALRVFLKSGRFGAAPLIFPAISDKLSYCWQTDSSFLMYFFFYFLRIAAAAVFLTAAQALPNCTESSAHSIGIFFSSASWMIPSSKRFSASRDKKIFVT
jgi:uncharacterized protein (DUF2236 family)